MTRYETHQQKQFKKRALYYTIFAVIILFLFFSVGIPFLANSSFFLTNFFKKSSDSQSQLGTFGNINITDIPTATNSATILIEGTVENVSSLQFYLNGEKVETLNTQNKSDFSQEIGSLKAGSNNVYLLALLENSKERKQTDTYTVIYKTNEPKLDISEPGDGSKTSKDEIKVAGKTDLGNSIRINDLPVVVDTNGNFQASVRLKEGENKIVIVAQDDAGNIETKTLTVTYEKD